MSDIKTLKIGDQAYQIKDQYARDHIEELFVDKAAKSAMYSDGDVIVTSGYTAPGIGAGIYVVHDVANAYCIAFGDKYAELLFDDVIDIEALGVEHDPGDSTVAVDLALNIIKNKRNSVPLSSGYTIGGAVIKFSNYLYRFNSSISIPENLSAFTFEGSNGTMFAYDGTGYLIALSAKTDGTKNDRVVINNITFIGSASQLHLVQAYNSKVENCRFFNSNVGVVIDGESVDNIIHGCMFVGCTVGIYVYDVITTLTIEKCYLISNGTAISIDGNNQAKGVFVRDCAIEGNTKAFDVIKASNVEFVDCWLEGNSGNISGSEVMLNNVVTVPDFNGVVSKITNDTANGRSIITARGVDDNVTFSTLDPTYSGGRIEYTNGEYFDTSKRELCVIDRSSITINFGEKIEGFVEGTGEYGTLYGYFVVDPGVSSSFTKDGGSLAGMYAVYDTGELVLLGFGARNTVRITY